MQGKQRLALAVVAILVVALVATVGTASAVQEVCTTTPVLVPSGARIVCVILNAYAYGPLTTGPIQIIDSDGNVVAQDLLSREVAPQVTAIFLTSAPQLRYYHCRVTVEVPLPGYALVTIDQEQFAQPAGSPALCTPF